VCIYAYVFVDCDFLTDSHFHELQFHVKRDPYIWKEIQLRLVSEIVLPIPTETEREIERERPEEQDCRGFEQILNHPCPKRPMSLKRAIWKRAEIEIYEQDCAGLAEIFCLLPTSFICWRVRQVSRCWCKVCVCMCSCACVACMWHITFIRDTTYLYATWCIIGDMTSRLDGPGWVVCCSSVLQWCVAVACSSSVFQ